MRFICVLAMALFALPVWGSELQIGRSDQETSFSISKSNLGYTQFTIAQFSDRYAYGLYYQYANKYMLGSGTEVYSQKSKLGNSVVIDELEANHLNSFGVYWSPVRDIYFGMSVDFLLSSVFSKYYDSTKTITDSGYFLLPSSQDLKVGLGFDLKYNLWKYFVLDLKYACVTKDFFCGFGIAL